MSGARAVAYNTVIQAAARLFINALGVVSVALTTRYLGVEVYGQLTTALLFLALFSGFSDAGVTITAVRELAEGKRPWPQIVGNVITLRFFVGVAIAVATVALCHAIYGDAEHAFVVQAIDYLAITVVLAAAQTSATTVLSARLRNDLVMIGAVAGRAVSVAIVIAVVHYDLGYEGLLYATLVGTGVNLASDLYFSCRSVRIRPRFEMDYWKSLTLLAAPIGLASIIGIVYIKLDGLLLSLLRDSREVALYGVAYRVMDLLMLLPSVLSISVFPLLVAAQHDLERLRRITAMSLRVLDLVVAPLVIGTVVVASHLAALLGGREFEDAALPMAILVTGNVFLYPISGYSNALFAIGAQRAMLGAIALVLPFNIALNIAAIPLFGAPGAAGAVVASEAFGLWLLRRQYRRKIGSEVERRRLTAYLGAAGLMGGITWSVKVAVLPEPTFASLSALILIGASTYTGLLKVFGLVDVAEVKALLRPS